MVSPSWLTVTEAAQRTGVSVQYIWRLCNTGKLNARMRGSIWLIDPVSLNAYLKARTERIERIAEKKQQK